MAELEATVATGAEEAIPQDQTSEQEVPQQEQAQKEQQPSKYVTVEDLAKRDEQLVENLARKEEQLLARFKQSSRDREKAIAVQLDALKQSMQQRGAPLTTEQEAAFRQNMEDQFEQTESAQANAPQAESRQLHPAVARAYGIMGKRQVTIEPDDLEFKKFIEPELSKGPQIDADDLALATETAIKEKQARLASNKQKASVRAPGGGGERASDLNDISNINDSKELYKRGEEKIEAQNNKQRS